MTSRKTPLAEVIFYVIDQTAKQQKQYSQKQLDAVGAKVTVDQWVLLKTIDEFQPISQTELAAEAIKDTASITRMLDLLEKKGLVERTPDENDRRKYLIRLSKEGDYFVAQYMDLVIDLRKRGLEGFSEKEMSLLRSMLLRIQKNMS